MARAKLFAGAAIGLCYFLVSFILLGHRNTASSVIAAREDILKRSPCINCIIIAGGSNSIYGIRTGIVEDRLGLDTRAQGVVNVALWNEGFSFSSYFQWLSHLQLKPAVLIYSSAGFYSLNESALSDGPRQQLDGESLLSIFSSTRLITKLMGKDVLLRFDDHGDLANYRCSAQFDPIEFKPFDRRAADRFTKHIRALGGLYRGSLVYLRIPPAYISRNQRSDWIAYFGALRKVFEEYKLADQLLNFPPQIIVDKNKFCDSPLHVRREFGEVLSFELAHDIKAHVLHTIVP